MLRPLLKQFLFHRYLDKMKQIYLLHFNHIVILLLNLMIVYYYPSKCIIVLVRRCVKISRINLNTSIIISQSIYMRRGSEGCAPSIYEERERRLRTLCIWGEGEKVAHPLYEERERRLRTLYMRRGREGCAPSTL